MVVATAVALASVRVDRTDMAGREAAAEVVDASLDCPRVGCSLGWVRQVILGFRRVESVTGRVEEVADKDPGRACFAVDRHGDFALAGEISYAKLVVVL